MKHKKAKLNPNRFNPPNPPVGFVTDSGKWFDVELVKANIKTYHLRLQGPNKVIKVRRNSPKLRYKKGD